MAKKDKKEELTEKQEQKPKLTSKIDKDGNYVFDPEKVKEMLKWVIKKSSKENQG
jgi:sugar-specific transcriptional regulator TrmB